MPTTEGALAGTRVVEVGHYVAGPQCAQILADHGADVIKVEPPGGERGRQAAPVHDGASLYFAANNRAKRSITLDMGDAAGQEVLHRLLSTADALVTNYTPATADRLGLAHDTLLALNPRLVIVHITGFGLSSARSDWVAYDGVIQAMSGLADRTGEGDGPPTVSGIYVADQVTALQATIGVLLGLAARSRTGEGQVVDVAMLDAMLPLMSHFVGLAAAGLPAPPRSGNTLPTAFSDLYRTTDGWVYIAPVAPAMWHRFAAALGHPEWSDAETACPGWRMDARTELNAAIGEWAATRTAAEAAEYLQSHGIAAGPARAVSDLVTDPDAEPRGQITHMTYAGVPGIATPGVAAKLSATPSPTSGRPAPEVGEHTHEILTELGLQESP